MSHGSAEMAKLTFSIHPPPAASHAACARDGHAGSFLTGLMNRRSGFTRPGRVCPRVQRYLTVSTRHHSALVEMSLLCRFSRNVSKSFFTVANMDSGQRSTHLARRPAPGPFRAWRTCPHQCLCISQPCHSQHMSCRRASIGATPTESGCHSVPTTRRPPSIPRNAINGPAYIDAEHMLRIHCSGPRAWSAERR